MKQYHDFLMNILQFGEKKHDRTGVGTISKFGYQMRYDLSQGFPLVTTKRIHLKSVIEELLWMTRGETNIKPLVDRGVRIWNDWPYARYKESDAYQNESMDAFIDKIAKDPEFAERHGDLGPVYGKQWRGFEGKDTIIDQLSLLIDEIKHNPNSRRLIVSAWNPPLIPQMSLPPCHLLFQFYVASGRLSCQLYQRSADAFLGVPFNIASYALLTHMIAKMTGLDVGEFIHTLGDCHIYLNHLEQVNTLLSRVPRQLPKLLITGTQSTLDDFQYEDFVIVGYHPYPTLKAKVAV